MASSRRLEHTHPLHTPTTVCQSLNLQEDWREQGKKEKNRERVLLELVGGKAPLYPTSNQGQLQIHFRTRKQQALCLMHMHIFILRSKQDGGP